jgi:expansin (peptidoglycan-binding protein)
LFLAFTLLVLFSGSLSAASDVKSAGGQRLPDYQVHQTGKKSANNSEAVVFLPMITQFIDGIIPFGPVHIGEGTYYKATGAGNCLFPESPDNLMVAAMNHTDYDHAALCGAYISVEGPDGSVMVRIVDRCPECPMGDVDLSREAFALIAEPRLGRVPIRWQQVSPQLDGPIVYHFKDGSNQWWTAVQIRNHRNPVARVEYLTESGFFQEALRTDYNYFVESSGMGPGPFTFRVTDVFGNAIVDSGIPHIEDGSISGKAQFPPPP